MPQPFDAELAQHAMPAGQRQMVLFRLRDEEAIERIVVGLWTGAGLPGVRMAGGQPVCIQLSCNLAAIGDDCPG